MDDLSKKKIKDLESKLQLKTIECESLQSSILILTQQMEATEVSLKLLTKSLISLEQQFKRAGATRKQHYVNGESDFLA